MGQGLVGLIKGAGIDDLLWISLDGIRFVL